MDNFSNLMMIGECLLDAKRVALFKRALKKVVKSGSVVIDGGTGSGIMALLAADAGAQKVYAVEINPDISNWAKKNIHNNKLQDTIEVLNEDMKTIKLEKPADVVVMEMLDTGLVAEQQLQAMNQLIEAGLVSEKTQCIPSRIESYIQLCNYDFNFYGFDMPFIIQARNFGVKKRCNKNLSDKVRIADIKFNQHNNPEHTFSGRIQVTESGKLNAIVLTSKTTLARGVHTWGTTDMNMPVIIPIEEIDVAKDQLISFVISYKMGHGYETLKFEIIK